MSQDGLVKISQELAISEVTNKLSYLIFAHVEFSGKCSAKETFGVFRDAM